MEHQSLITPFRTIPLNLQYFIRLFRRNVHDSSRYMLSHLRKYLDIYLNVQYLPTIS